MSKRPPTSAKRESFLKAGKVSAVLIGGLISFLLTPLIFNATADHIAQYGNDNYVQGIGGFAKVVWWVVVAVLTTTLSIVSITAGTKALIIKVLT